jgi:cold shock CspA family protein
MTDKQTTTTETNTTYTGRVKWFNNKAGYGFVTIIIGERQGEDIFVHHSGVKVNSEQYKYLVQGEYVEFDLKTSENTEHPFQAFDVTGVGAGKLMCETRTEQRQQREEDDGDDRRGGDRRGDRRGGDRRGDRRDNRRDNRRGERRRGGESGSNRPGDEWNLEKN